MPRLKSDGFFAVLLAVETFLIGLLVGAKFL